MVVVVVVAGFVVIAVVDGIGGDAILPMSSLARC